MATEQSFFEAQRASMMRILQKQSPALPCGAESPRIVEVEGQKLVELPGYGQLSADDAEAIGLKLAVLSTEARK